MFLRRSDRRSCSQRALSIFRMVVQTFSRGACGSDDAKRELPTAAGFQRGWRSLRPYVLGASLVLALIGWPMRGNAQSAVAVVTTGNGPRVIGINPVTNKIYIANTNGNPTNDPIGNLTVVDGATNAITTVTIGNIPVAIAVNPVTNKIYVVNQNSNNVTVVDGATNNTTTVAVGSQPNTVAINTVTNKIYVGNSDLTVTVIDGATNDTTSVPGVATTGNVVTNVAVNSVTNKIYAVNESGVVVIDGVTNVVTPVTTGNALAGVAVNPVTNKIYVGDEISPTVIVIDGATNNTTTVTAGSGFSNSPDILAVNPVTNKIYVLNAGLGAVIVIDGATNGTTTITDANTLLAMTVNPTTNQIYVTNNTSDANGVDTMTIIDGGTNAVTSVVELEGGDGDGPVAIGVNPVTNQIYVVCNIFGALVVVDGDANNTATVTTGTSPTGVAVNPATNKIYAPNSGDGTVTVIDGPTKNTSTVTAGTDPFAAAVNVVTNTIYVTNQGSANVTVIDGANNTTATIAAGTNPEALAVNAVTNKIYVANHGSGNVTVIDGTTNTTTTVTAGTQPGAVAVNPVTNTIYVANVGSANVTVINGATNATSTVTVGTNPEDVAVNPVTNKIYVANAGSGNVTVINGATNATATVTVGTGPFRLAVNSVTNKIYVTNQGSGTVTEIDGVTNTTSTVTVGTSPQFVAVNAATNKTYVTNSGSANVSVINGNANEVGGLTTVSATVTAGNTPGQVAINPITNQIYVANLNSGNVTVISAAQAQPALLTTTVAPIPGGVSASTTPIFTFTANSTFSPAAPGVENVYFQLDSTDGPWIAATAGTGNFTGTPASALQFGTHIVYAFATDGQDANLDGMDGSSEPSADVIFIGSITGQVFTVTPPPSTTVTLTSNNNPAQTGQSVTFTAVVTSASAGTPTGTVTFNDGATPLGTGPLNGSATATFTTSTLAAASHSITAVYGGDTNFSGSTSAVLTEVVNAATNPLPTVTSLSPNTELTGSAAFSLTVNGTGFVSASVVNFNGSARATTFVSGTQLTAAILATDLVTAGTPPVTVTSPLPAGGTSNSVNFNVNNPVPTIATLSPASATAGSGAFTLIVTGTNFTSTSVVSFNGNAKATSFVSATQLSAAILATDVTTAGTPAVIVTNPTPGGGPSNSVMFTVNNPLPTLATLSPTGTTVSTGAFALTVTGTGFVSNSVVNFNGAARVTAFVSATQLSAAILATDITTIGTPPVTVTNLGPGGGTSNAINFNIAAAPNPVPTVTSLSPNNIVAGSAGFTLTVNGTNFVSTSTVNFGGAARATTFVSATQVTALILAGDVATPGSTPGVTVTNPAPGGGTSTPVTFTVNNPVPTTTSISPNTAAAGTAAFTLTVNGTNFVSNSVVQWQGSTRVTTFVSATKLMAAITAADVSASNSISVTVLNPAPGGGGSNGQTFFVSTPVGVLTTLSPSTAVAGGAAFTLTVNGSNFLNTAVVQWNGSNRTTTFVSANQLTAAITAADIATVGSATVQVFIPTVEFGGASAIRPQGGPSGTFSNSLTFTITAPNPVPTLTAISPSLISAGGAGFTMTLTGTNFVSSSVAQVKGSARVTTFVSATSLTAAITAADITSSGTAAITVFTPTPGGGTTAAINLTITDFSVTPTPTTQTVAAGSPTTYTINTATVGGVFANTVSFTASGLPTGSGATFSPTSVAPGASTMMTVTTTARGLAEMTPFNPGGTNRPLWLIAVLLALALTSLGFAKLGRRSVRRLIPVGAFALLLISAGYLSGCAGSGFPKVGSNLGTPAGTYTITVTGTSGTDVHSTTVTLVVQ